MKSLNGVMMQSKWTASSILKIIQIFMEKWWPLCFKDFIMFDFVHFNWQPAHFPQHFSPQPFGRCHKVTMISKLFEPFLQPTLTYLLLSFCSLNTFVNNFDLFYLICSILISFPHIVNFFSMITFLYRWFAIPNGSKESRAS